jgi:DNA-binding response OmpR family regulator
MSTHILLLEDDKLFNETLQDFLEEEGFSVDGVYDPYSALDLTFDNNYDLYLFDVNLPYENGFDLLKKLRACDDMTPTIFITSRDDRNSLYEGFKEGGDDYIVKPVDLDELLLRIQALLRRQIRLQKIQIDSYEFDSITKKLYFNNEPIEISMKVAELLLILLKGQGEVVTFEEIKAKLWTTSQEASDKALRVYVTQLKKYFPTQIKNIRGIGYQMRVKC